MTEAGNILVGGLVTGAIYALLAVGFSLVFSVSGILNLAQGAFVTAGALVMYSFIHSAGLSVPLAFLASLIVLALFVAIVEWVIIRPAVTQISHTNLLMLMGGLLISYQGAAFLIWGANPYSLAPFSGTTPFNVDGLTLVSQDFWVIGALVICVGVVSWVLSRTKMGKGLRATAENMSAARLMGIKADRMIMGSFVAAALLGVIAGAVVAPLISLDFVSMTTFTNAGLIAVTLGGLGTIFGSVAGGLALGIFGAVVTGYVSSLLGSALTLVVMIAVIVVRPQGLLSRQRGNRADVATRARGKVVASPRMRRADARVVAVIVVVVMFLMPKFMPAGDMRAVNITGVFALVVIGLDLLTGVAGQVSLGQGGFMGIGAYATAILTTKYNLPPITGLAVGLALTVVVAMVLALVCSRVRGLYLAIVTLAFGILVPTLAADLTLTGGPSGLSGVPVFSVAGYAFDNDTKFFYLIWSIVLVALIGTANLVRSNRGRIFRAMHGDETGARSLGLNTPRAKIAVFVISASMASIAGSLYADYFRYLSPEMVSSGQSLGMMTMVVVGGLGTVVGPLIGVGIITYVPLVFQSVSNYAPLIEGALLVGFLRYLPTGIYGSLVGLLNRIHAGIRRFEGRGGSVSQPVLAFSIGAETSRPSPVMRASSRPGESAPVGTLHLSEAGPSNGAGEHSPGVPGGNRSADSENTPALRVSHLSKAFGGINAVDDVSFEVDSGSICALIGPNGAGKSTTFNLITNIYRPDAGEVELWGENITGIPPNEVTSLGLLRTFQTSRIFAQLTVLENVLVGGYRMGKASYLDQTLRLRRSRHEERDLERQAMLMLDVVGLAERASDLADVLPLAAQKSVELVRALMAQPRLILLDEPGAGMNEAETAELGAMLLAIRATGHTVLVVEHNMSLVMGVADRVVVMDAGRVIALGSPEQVQHDPLVIEAYFGKVEASA
ncbi:MAG TPA: branched-chain amino acid ABC transporter permease/ATP-binding protein [Acidimicrobiales bacterium]|nr:branched-chain amino acid ABC transporter permease/ATP-binding protein [Acidimicrobiales bacterium]